MSDKLILYNLDISPPVRAVKIVARLLGLELDIRDIDVFKGEQLKEPLVSINPEHTVPTLVDGDFVIWDSHTICGYLVDKYAKSDFLYPKDLQLRAKCNQRLFFNASRLFVRVRDCTYPIMFKGAKEVPQEKIEQINAAFDILEAFLATDHFLVGNSLTIADISVSLSILALELYVPLQPDKYSKILTWLKRISQTIPFFDEVNHEITEHARKVIREKLEKNNQNA